MMDWIFGVIQNVASILAGLSVLLIPKVRDFLVNRYQNSLDKALEDRKASNERKNYVSKVRFDKEFEIYEELSLKMLLVNRYFNLLTYVMATSSDDAEYEENYYKLEKYCVEFETAFFAYSPFINEEIYKLYEEFYKLTSQTVNLYKCILISHQISAELYVPNAETMSKEANDELNELVTKEQEVFEMNKQTNALSNEISSKLRKYLHNLEVEQ